MMVQTFFSLMFKKKNQDSIIITPHPLNILTLIISPISNPSPPLQIKFFSQSCSPSCSFSLSSSVTNNRYNWWLNIVRTACISSWISFLVVYTVCTIFKIYFPYPWMSEIMPIRDISTSAVAIYNIWTWFCVLVTARCNLKSYHQNIGLCGIGNRRNL